MSSDPALRLASAGKVAIPALRPRAEPAQASPPAVAKGKRTAKACVECKSKKIKCSGTRPTCDYCEPSQIPCVFADGRRERSKKANARGHRLLHLLREASNQAALPRPILDELNSLEAEMTDDAEYFDVANTAGTKRRDTFPATEPDEKRPRRESTEHSHRGELDVSADVGSEESVDLAAEDFNRTEAKDSGFIGKHSEIAWAQRLAQVQAENTGQESKSTSHGKAGTGEGAGSGRVAAVKTRHAPENASTHTVSDFFYHMDNSNNLKLDQVDPDELPTTEHANTLIECYMENVHNFFPILIKPDFTQELQAFCSPTSGTTTPATWRAMLNMVFAIGAKFSHLIGAPWHGDDRDHLLYHTRTMQLCPINESTMVQPDLQRLQVIALVSFYYLAIGHVSRSWIMLGVACRQATALGIHLRQLSPSMSLAAREKRVRIWWSLYYLEYMACQITGRPTMINHQFCSAPPVAPVDESTLATGAEPKQLQDWNNNQEAAPAPADSSASRTILSLAAAAHATNHFRGRVQLAIITQKIFINLYSATTVSKTWQRLQEEITALGQEVDQWYRSLPRAYQFTLALDSAAETDDELTRERIILAFSYYSAKMILSRPCLCRIDERIANQSASSQALDAQQARECIMAARSLAALLPDPAPVPDLVWLYYHGPWWATVHYFMQAITVLLLELAFKGSHLPPDSSPSDLDRIVAKLVRWLAAMAAAGNPTAAAACRQVRTQLDGFDGPACAAARDMLAWPPDGLLQPAAFPPFPAQEGLDDPLLQGQWQAFEFFRAEEWNDGAFDDALDWNQAFSHTPYDLFNPLPNLAPLPAFGAQVWMGYDDGGGGGKAGEGGGGAGDGGFG